MKGINTTLKILAHYDRMLLPDHGHNFKSYSFGVMPLFSRMMYPERQALVPHTVLFLRLSIKIGDVICFHFMPH